MERITFYSFVCFTALGLLLSMLGGCATSGANTGNANQGTIAHVVICWLKNPGNEADRLALEKRSFELAKIPGVLSVHAGRTLTSERPIVDDSFDVAVVMTFESEEALQNYEKHPEHKRAVAEILKPLTSRVIVYDIKQSQP